MAFSLSIKEMVVVVISVCTIVFGLFFMFQISLLKDTVAEIPLPFLEKDLNVKVIPENSQQGTVFLIRAEKSKINEGQNMRLLVKGENSLSNVLLYDDGQHSDFLEHDGVYGGFFDSGSKGIGVYEVNDGENAVASFSVSEEKCEIIEGRYKDSYKFLILPSGYTDYEEFRKDSINVIRGKDSILTVSPFNAARSKISFSILNTTRDLECKNNCKNVSAIVCCNEKAVSEESSRCTHDGVIVLYKSSELCGSASSYAKICSQNKLSPMALMHELGHSFGDLADEYTYQDYSVGKVDSPNCDSQGCGKWGGITAGCFKGCTYSDLYRSEEKNSIMYTFYPSYNEVSREHLNELINGYNDIKTDKERGIPDESYSVSLSYKNGSISLGDVFLKPIETSPQLKKSEYSALVRGITGETIFETNLSLPVFNYPLPNSSASPYNEESFEYLLSLPYYSDGMKIEILDNGKKKAEKNVAGLAQLCGNSVCDSGENHISCSVDCSIENDNFCQDNALCDPNCGTAANNCFVKEKIYRRGGIVLVVISLLSLISMGYRIYRRRKEKPSASYRN